ncbi:MAG: radical SAM protein [Clostridiales Family XIII bacterium]|nr:radical SAM protein [Clostridiales Family XIII bacterium]
MIKVRAEQKALLFWNSELSRTAYISGEELSALRDWAGGRSGRSDDRGDRADGHSYRSDGVNSRADGRSGGFIDRLMSLGIINDSVKEDVKEAIAASDTAIAPPRSFCAPESLHIELTSKCPVNCPQCYKECDDTDLPSELLFEVIRQADEMDVFQIALGGGEPLLYPQIIGAIAEISRCGMGSSITTSGLRLDGAFLTELKTAGLKHIQISLNGSREEIHSRSRGGYEYGMAALKLLKDSNISFGVNWVARMDNIDDFPQLIETARSHRASNINILRYKPSPKENYQDVRLTPEKMDSLESFISDAKGIRVKVDSAFSNLLCHINQRVSYFSGCGAGRRFIAVDADGFYRPCSHVGMSEASGDLRGTWYNSANLTLFRSIPDRISEPCSSCAALNACYGCRAVVLGQGEGFFGGDRTCPYELNFI